MEFEFDKARWTRDSEGFWLCLRVKAFEKARKFVQDMKNRPYTAALKEKRNHRSLDANGYFWCLCDRLAQVTGIPKMEIYREAIRNIGGNTETVCIPTKGVEKLCRGWEHNGLGWLTDTVESKLQDCTNVILYYGSSSYDSGQMSRLIDNIVQDCKAVGIETKTPEELSLLKSRWKDAEADKSA